MSEAIGKLICSGKFEPARQAIIDSKFERIETLLLHIGSYEANVSAYGFVCYLIFLDESIYLHEVVVSLFLVSLTYLEGAYSVIYYHGLLLNSLKSNCVPHLGSELVLYGIPGGGISDEEARETVKKASSLNISIGFTERVLKETVYLEGKTYLSTEQKQAALIEENIKVAIKEFFLTGRFLVAKKILPEMSWDEIYAMLLSMAQNERSICAYSFMWLLQKEEETCQRHLLHAEIAWETFKHVDGEQYPVNGAEALRFFHRHRAAELAPDNIEIQEKLLSLYLPNDPKFDLKETKERAKHILATNPASSIAQKVLWEITNCLGE